MAKKRAKNTSDRKPRESSDDPFGNWSLREHLESQAAAAAAKERSLRIHNAYDKNMNPTYIRGQEVRVPLTNSRGEVYGHVTQVVPARDPFGSTIPYRDPMAGRTVDAGTRSMLRGMIRFLRGGGGPLLRGK